eukprot:827744-Rhodomonas_salina.2
MPIISTSSATHPLLPAVVWILAVLRALTLDMCMNRIIHESEKRKTAKLEELMAKLGFDSGSAAEGFQGF